MIGTRYPARRVLVILCCVLVGCVGRRASDLRPQLHQAAPETSTESLPAIAYSTHFVGPYPEGSVAFIERVGGMLARHPAFRAARWGDTDAPLQLELTLTDRSNQLLAGVSGLLCGLSFSLLPAYARDDFDLDVELRAGTRSLWHRQYHDAVTTIVHFTLVFAPRSEQPRIVVEDVVDDLVWQALVDLDASGTLQLAADTPKGPQ
jgi:hypothetical protein